MTTRDCFDFLSVDCQLSCASVNHAAALHTEKYGIPPTTLIIATSDVMLAYEILSERWGRVPFLVIVPVPGWRGWAVCSPNGVVASGWAL